jgi:SAM-dependent methyltransferase
MDGYTRANRANWNAWTALNAASAHYDVAGFEAGTSTLNAIERDELGAVAGKSLLHLQCHFGLDTLSWARLGAAATGVDFAEEAVALAQELNRDAGLDARFMCADLYDLPAALTGTFDIVYTSGGVLFWLKDLDRWAEIVAHFLAPGGVFYLLEMHPVINVFDRQDATGLRVAYPYFHTREPIPFTTTGTFADPGAGHETVEYSWNYGLGEVVTALIGAGLRIEYLHEFPYATAQWFPFMRQGTDGWWRWDDPTNTLPLLFSLRATK